MSEHKQVSPLMRRLSTYIAGALKRKIPREVAERAKPHLLDTFAAMVSGSRQPPGKHAIAFIKPLGGAQQAGVIGTRTQRAAGITTMFRDPHHIEKAYAMGGMPAHNGVAAALMAAQGFTGVEDVYSGEPDFF